MTEESRGLTEEERRAFDEAREKLRAAARAQRESGVEPVFHEKSNEPVFVDRDGNVQHEPPPETAAHHADFLRKAARQEHLRRERDADQPVQRRAVRHDRPS